jgi:ribose transport system ATP-binding protein
MSAMPTVATEPSVETGVVLRNVSKSYPGVKALSNVDFDCRPGEVHALVGENGSGKSTLIKIAAGVLTADAGAVVIAGESMSHASIKHARKIGLMTAYQDTSLVAELTVEENLALSFDAIGEPRPPDLHTLLERYELPFKTSDLVSSLGIGARQLLEVARAMCHSPKVLLLDEPTAALDMRLASYLEKLVREARDAGTAIVYVSHRLAEVRRLADRVTVLRDGVVQGTHASNTWDVDEIVELMVGAPTDLEFPKRTPDPHQAVRLEARDLSGPGYGPVSLSVRAGEIVGIAGAEGNGQRALLRGLIGVGHEGGKTLLDGKPLTRNHPAKALDAGISFQSGDRAADSIFGPLPVADNLTAQAGAATGPLGLTLLRRLRAMYASASARFGIVTASPFQPISALSGGNQQKIVLARPMLRTPKVLVVDEPTQGVDARARMDIYRMLADATAAGVAVLVNSSDSSELAGLCDRVYIMSRGRVIQELTGPTTETEIVRSFVAAAGDEHRGRTEQARSSVLTRALGSLSSYIPIVVLAVLCASLALYVGSKSETFWTGPNLANLMLLTLPLGLVSLGQQYTLLSGGLDLSVGATMSLTVVMASLTLPDFTAGSLLMSIPIFLLIAVAVGGFNALLIGPLKVNAIVATIATTGIVQGVAIVLRPQPGGFIAPQLTTAFSRGIGFIPTSFLGLIALAVALEFWLNRGRGGLALRAAGFNAESTNRVGRRVIVVRSVGFVVCSLGAVLGGICLASLTAVGSNDVGTGYTLPCFAAVFLGGAVLSGGRGSFVGSLLGALFLSMLDNAKPLLNIPSGLEQMVYGLILIIAVGMYAFADRRRAASRRT